jgi:hypothetical protein
MRRFNRTARGWSARDQSTSSFTEADFASFASVPAKWLQYLRCAPLALAKSALYSSCSRSLVAICESFSHGARCLSCDLIFIKCEKLQAIAFLTPHLRCDGRSKKRLLAGSSLPFGEFESFWCESGLGDLLHIVAVVRALMVTQF